MSEMKQDEVGTGNEDDIVFTPRDVMLALRYDGNDEDIRFTQLDIGRCLHRLSPNHRAMIFMYAAGYNVQESLKALHIDGDSRILDRAIKKLTNLLNGEER